MKFETCTGTFIRDAHVLHWQSLARDRTKTCFQLASEPHEPVLTTGKVTVINMGCSFPEELAYGILPVEVVVVEHGAESTSVTDKEEPKAELPQEWRVVETIHGLEQLEAVKTSSLGTRTASKTELAKVEPDVTWDRDEDLSVHRRHRDSEILTHHGDVLEGNTLEKS